MLQEGAETENPADDGKAVSSRKRMYIAMRLIIFSNYAEAKLLKKVESFSVFQYFLSVADYYAAIIGGHPLPCKVYSE